MPNAEIPPRAELPSAARLVKSTVISAVPALMILVVVMLPAEYRIGPTGVGRALQLTELVEIKNRFAIDAEADRQSSLPALVARLLVAPAAAHSDHMSSEIGPLQKPPDSIAQAPAAAKTDETVITLKPNEGVEYKLTMVRGAKVQYSWHTEGGGVNYDMHGTPKSGGKETSYRKGRDIAADAGMLTAAYDGSHGWYWRNWGPKSVTIILKTSGAYSEIKRAN